MGLKEELQKLGSGDIAGNGEAFRSRFPLRLHINSKTNKRLC